jgi:hypothetical protein
MAYNKLSGTIIAPDYFGPAPGDPFTKIVGILSGTLEGDGTLLEGVPRIVSNVTENNLLTIGINDNELVGEPYLNFNGGINHGTLHVTGDISASINISASTFWGSAAGLFDLPAGVGGDGPSGSVQIMTQGGQNAHMSGTTNLLFTSNVLQIKGTMALSRRTLTSNGTASSADYIIGMDSTNTTIGFELQKANTLVDGQILIIKDEGGGADTNNITINASGSDKIDGQNFVVLESPYASIQLFCNGADKYFIY